MAKIKLNNNEYLISDSTLATLTADFIAHLGTVAGNGLKVAVNGVEYGVDSSKMSATIAALETVFGNLSGGAGGGSWKGTPVIGTWDGESDITPDQIVDGIYFNTSLSADEVVGMMKSASPFLVDDPRAGAKVLILEAAYYPNNDLTTISGMVNDEICAILNTNNGEIIFCSSKEAAESLGTPVDFEGWNPNFNGVISGPLAVSQPGTYMGSYMPPTSSAEAMTALSSLISLTPFEKEGGESSVYYRTYIVDNWHYQSPTAVPLGNFIMNTGCTYGEWVVDKLPDNPVESSNNSELYVYINAQDEQVYAFMGGEWMLLQTMMELDSPPMVVSDISEMTREGYLYLLKSEGIIETYGGTPVIGAWDGVSEPTPEQIVDAVYFNTGLSVESVTKMVIQAFKYFLEELGENIDISEARYPFNLIEMSDINNNSSNRIIAMTDGVDVVIGVLDYASASGLLLFTSSVEFAEKAGVSAEKVGWASDFSGVFTGSFALIKPMYFESYQLPFASITTLNMLSGLMSLTPYNN